MNSEPGAEVRGDHAPAVVCASGRLKGELVSVVARRGVERAGYMWFAKLRASVQAEVGEEVSPEAVEKALEAVPGFRWLGRRRGAFWFGGQSSNRVVHELRKILETGRVVEAAELREALRRTGDYGNEVVPAGVLLEMCRQEGGCEIDGRSVRPSAPGERRSFGDYERWIYETFASRGGQMTGAAVIGAAKAAGLSSVAVRRALRRASIVTGDFRAGFRLVGRDASDGPRRVATMDEVAEVTREVAKRLVSRSGFGALKEVHAIVCARCGKADASLVELGVGAMDGVEWLDRLRGWYWFGEANNVLVDAVRKVLSVASEMSLEGLREAVMRAPQLRDEGERLETRVVFVVCASLPGVRVEGQVVRSELVQADGQLSAAEAWLVELFHRSGPSLSWGEVCDEALVAGRASRVVKETLKGSPLVRRLSSGVYGLVGGAGG